MRGEYCYPVSDLLIPVFCSVTVGTTSIKLRGANFSITGGREIDGLLLNENKLETYF